MKEKRWTRAELGAMGKNMFQFIADSTDRKWGWSLLGVHWKTEISYHMDKVTGDMVVRYR